MLPCARTCGRGSGQLLQPLRIRVRHQTTHAKAPRKVIFSGIQPTGVPHLGNYLGALRQWVKLQDEAEKSTSLIYSLVDLHAITVRQDPAQLRQWKKESLAMLLAIGLDPMRSTIFHQSDVPSHVELMWILSCQASTGYLGRMTQWKDRTKNEKEGGERLKLGLFSYPVLQAADVLVHQTTHVPVGHDQAQHLEFAREIAIGFNHQYNTDILVPPETLISPAKRVMSLADPGVKMSKSAENPKSRILLTDSEETIQAKLKAAVTDSLPGIEYDPERRPGVSNLIDIIHHAGQTQSDATTDGSGQNALAKDMEQMSLRAIKERAAEAVEKLIRPIRERYAEVLADEALLEEAQQAGAFKAQITAADTMRKVKTTVGLA
ncbi:Tryptophan--tRNA ligase, mitochondrial [Lecanosticta acicola]|uniref:Tryptophan--tRNA ligase, mitochondrial n=1 Tax=Lecanosticta acicola TaxID=111012 RepID=A0AAI8YW03_9PEZI|nr:Tryptophan--tRNA ligase, mitochondrial [Lecanosticta acicola]